MNKKAEELFQDLWTQYTEQNPSALKIYNLFTELGEEVVNDHIAFRTINDKRFNIDRLAEPFLEAGYRQSGSYHFRAKKLFAKHFELPDSPEAPRIFISELLLEEMPGFIRDVYNDAIKNAVLPEGIPLVLAGNIFGKPSYVTFRKMIEVSEYAGWFYVHGFRVNHFTVSINHLKKYNDISRVNQLLKDNGFPLNTSGGEIKGSPEVYLEQSSTLADRVAVAFTEGTFEVPACYYEFAKRYPDETGSLFSGFIADSADKIFESTDEKPGHIRK